MPQSDRIDQQIGNYRLVRLLGCGGSGCVYSGHHIHIHKQAAIKVLREDTDQMAQDMFLQEAENIEKLKHSHIIRILDFGRESRDNAPYLVMEYASGGTLRHRHPSGTIVPLATVAEYVKQIAPALQYVHDHNLIHCDLKPENLLVGDNGEVLLSDFGIAVIVYGRSSDMETGPYAGTVPYSAPEQIRGKPRRASDQYALGIILYEWLTGERPFRGAVGEIISQHFSDPPRPLREIVPTIPSQVEAVVLKALVKDPAQRFPSVEAFATAFEQASQPSPPPPVPPPPIPRWILSIVSGILLVLLLGTFFASRVLTPRLVPPTPTVLSPASTPRTTPTVSSIPVITSKDECINGGLPGVALGGLGKPAGTVQIESGTGWFSALSPTAKALTVQPGASLNGQITLLTLNQLPDSNQAPLIGTPSWGNDSTGFWTITNLIGTRMGTTTTSVSLTAPSQPGTYYIIFAFQAEVGGDHVASATNWLTRTNVWNDGNDIAEFTASQIAQAQQFGCTTNKILMRDGYLLTYEPADAVTVSVRSSGN